MGTLVVSVFIRVICTFESLSWITNSCGYNPVVVQKLRSFPSIINLGGWSASWHEADTNTAPFFSAATSVIVQFARVYISFSNAPTNGSMLALFLFEKHQTSHAPAGNRHRKHEQHRTIIIH